jgi:hypothetical protein
LDGDDYVLREVGVMYAVLVGAPGRPRHRWEENIKMDLQEVGWGGGTWAGLIWHRTGTGGGLL